MFLSLDIAAGGLQAQQTNVDVISQNLANLSTTGYKRQIPEFRDLLYQDIRRVGATSSDSGARNPRVLHAPCATPARLRKSLLPTPTG